MRYLTNDSTDPHWNMAFDETALTALPSPEPVFYLWQNRPAVIIGRNQSAPAEVNLPYLEEHGIVLARRVTGGGAVYHDLGNLNYSFVGGVREMDELQPVQLMAAALRSLGIPAEVSGRNDILVEGRKCSGYAKRLAGTRMMIHGTLMWNVDLAALSAALSVPGSKFDLSSRACREISSSAIASVRSKVCNLSEYLPGWTLEQFRANLYDYLSSGAAEDHSKPSPAATPVGCFATIPTLLRDRGRTRVLNGASSAPTDRTPSFHGSSVEPVSPAFLEQVNALADSKFRSWDWIHGRSPVTDFTASRKFPSCGTVRVHFSVRHGLLADVSFSGDFLGALSLDTPLPNDLCPAPLAGKTLPEALNGTRFDPAILSSVLTSLPVASYFDGLTAADLLSLFF